jgi:hypothetical protein
MSALCLIWVRLLVRLHYKRSLVQSCHLWLVWMLHVGVMGPALVSSLHFIIVTTLALRIVSFVTCR